MFDQQQYYAIETLKNVLHAQTISEFVEIGEQTIISCLKELFPKLMGNIKGSINLNDSNLYAGVKRLAESYENLVKILSINNKNEHGTIIGAQFKQKTQNVDLQSRKNTRATLAMRNSKNQQQLKKDQIFVRLIPRTHNCIHFMVKNQNFPRIQCRLSCNQHLQYLVNYLSNKWLRGKVGVGYQIKLYPDPSTYIHKHNNDFNTQSKRPNTIHEPLNNYLMFTDIMAAFGVAQNGCINLLYDITQLRKQKQKHNRVIDKQYSQQLDSYNLKVNKPQKSIIEHQKQSIHSSRKKSPKITLQQKQQQKLEHNLKLMLDHQDQSSLGLLPKEKKSHINYNSVDLSQVNSIGYQFNAFNSNHILGNLFNMNNSNTFLNIYTDPHKNVSDNANNTPSKAEIKNKPNSASKVSPLNPNTNQNSNANPITNTNTENKLQNIRNIINIIEQQVGPAINEVKNQILEKQQNQMQKPEGTIKKQVKTVAIIKKKNQNQ